ncbi:hypothetical protein E2320_010600 [Naja naja]|nr:hypothetical protein E2320_010600 [Naja naja]
MTKCNTGATLAMSWKDLNGFSVRDKNGHFIHQNAWSCHKTRASNKKLVCVWRPKKNSVYSK